jgi:hypothetical protein
MATFQVGDRVRHTGHGPGTVIEVREARSNSAAEYLLSRRGAAQLARIPGELVPAMVDSMYSPDRYPYRIRFDSGYTDVYSDNGLTPIQNL